MTVESLRHILCPVDFSDLSALALRYARTLSACGPAQVTVLYAHSFVAPAYFTQGQLEQLQRQLRASTDGARQELLQFVQTTVGSLGGLETRVVEAFPADGILRAASEGHADLIVMGTHGRSGLQRWRLGSVAERVLRESDIPVLTVRGQPSAAPVSIRNILCPVNESAVARESLRLASALAGCLNATLTVLHVEEEHPRDSIGDLCSWIEAQKHPQCHVRELLRRGDAAREIVAAAGDLQCDLLVIGARHRTFFDSTVIGTTTERVVRHAPCPVLTVVEKPPVKGSEGPQGGAVSSA